jgi:hypothetical protein
MSIIDHLLRMHVLLQQHLPDPDRDPGIPAPAPDKRGDSGYVTCGDDNSETYRKTGTITRKNEKLNNIGRRDWGR